VLEVLLPVEGSADADVHAGLEIEQTLFAGAEERGAVRVRGTEVGVPGVEVGIEVEDGDLPVRRVQRTQIRQGEAVGAAWGERAGSFGGHLVGSGLARGDGLCDVEGIDAEVTAVGDLLPGEGVDVRGLVVGPQQLRRLADVGGAEPGARAVADAGVEGDADDLYVDSLPGALCLDFVDARQQSEGRGPCVAGGLAVVGRAERLRRHWHSPSSGVAGPSNRCRRMMCHQPRTWCRLHRYPSWRN